MKIRCDFVTNSSNTSFVVWGVEIDVFELRKNKKLLDHIWNKYSSQHVFPEVFLPYKTIEELFEDGQALNETFMELLEDTGLAFASNFEVGCFFVGKSPFDMDDDQTLKNFKAGIRASLRKIGIERRRIGQVCETVPSG